MKTIVPAFVAVAFLISATPAFAEEFKCWMKTDGVTTNNLWIKIQASNKSEATRLAMAQFEKDYPRTTITGVICE